jgi:hypothetical protein
MILSDLKEGNRIIMEKDTAVQYWLFQSSPKVFRLRDALRYEALETFAVKTHRDKIKQDDRVILWQSGPEAGCYALATVREAPRKRPVSPVERPYFLEEPEEGLRVPIAIDYNLWYKPITTELLPDTPAIKDLNAGLPGTNFRASAAQYKQLVNCVEQLDLLQEPEVPYGEAGGSTHPLNLILYGPPGTGKTYQTLNHALSIIENRTLAELDLEDRRELHRRFLNYTNRGRVAMVTFHPSFAYEDFVEGLKPVMRDEKVEYEIQAGIFKRICRDARRSMQEEPPDSWRKYVLIIDEINRGNLAGIFGELITLIEPDKRYGRREALQVWLPYSKTPFSIPPNLYIIGTMNTTDRSAELIDAALRRRFAFREIQPDPKLIPRLVRKPIAAGVDLQRLLATINERIALLLGDDFRIGHGYFQDVSTLDDLRELFGQRIIPLLQDYFYNDLGKVGLVLGKEFVRPAPPPDMATVFADFDYPYTPDLTERRQYVLRRVEELEEKDFIRIYDPSYQGG